MSETHAGPVPAIAIVRVNYNTHLSAEDVAALVDGRVSPAHRRELDTHLATCSECRHEVVAASRIVDSSAAVRARHRRWTTAGIGLTAAAAILIAVLPRLPSPANHRSQAQERAAAPGAATLVTVSPAPGATTNGRDVRFVWHRYDDAAYRLFVTDSAGAPVYSAATSDTVVVLPAMVHLETGAHYHWYVDALRSDGTSVNSASSEFAIPPR